MRKFLIVLAILAVSCNSSKQLETNLNSWIGSTKQQLILKWGPPTQTSTDGNNGEVLMYAYHTYYTLTTGPVDYWEYRMMYINAEGKIYHWLYRKNPNPPQRVDIRVLTN